MIGRARWFDLNKGYGFIESPHYPKEDLLVHFKDIPEEVFVEFLTGEQIEFDLTESCAGTVLERAVAVNIRPVGATMWKGKILWVNFSDGCGLIISDSPEPGVKVWIHSFSHLNFSPEDLKQDVTVSFTCREIPKIGEYQAYNVQLLPEGENYKAGASDLQLSISAEKKLRALADKWINFDSEDVGELRKGTMFSGKFHKALSQMCNRNGSELAQLLNELKKEKS